MTNQNRRPTDQKTVRNNMEMEAFKIVKGDGPVVAAAVHDGGDVRGDIEPLFALDKRQRLREEDPFTGLWTAVADSQIIGCRSRFEVDLNRPRHSAVYQRPEDAWGLKVWNAKLAEGVVSASLEIYDDFYRHVHQLLSELLDQHELLVVLDLHSYNHLRDGADSDPADPQLNPEVNIGTGTMDREFWSPLIDRLVSDLRNANYPGRNLDVRENVKFQGGEFGRWIHENFPNRVCTPAIEFKKFFMNEWTGEPDRAAVDAIGNVIQSTITGLQQSLGIVSGKAR